MGVVIILVVIVAVITLAFGFTVFATMGVTTVVGPTDRDEVHIALGASSVGFGSGVEVDAP